VIARAYPPDGVGGPAERLEAQLEALAGAIEDSVLPAASLIGVQAKIERIAAVQTELQIEPGASTLVGSASLTFTLEWSESWPLRDPITCEPLTVALGFPSLSGL
jgi:hypothetical protein